MKNKFKMLKDDFDKHKINFDIIYDFLEGWITYAKNADTYKLRKKILADFESEFYNEISIKEINRYLKIHKKIN